jgi:hypothetical protein
MRTTLKAVSVTVALVVCLMAGSPAGATSPEVGHFSGEDHFAPFITDLPCLEGKEFVATGSVVFRGTFVNSEGFFHFTGIQRTSGTLVPVDGQGPTYVESGNVDKVNFTARDVSAGVQLVQTRVNNDRFLGYWTERSSPRPRSASTRWSTSWGWTPTATAFRTPSRFW